MTTPNRNKLAFYYFISAIALFAVGYGLAWFSEQPLFAKNVFPEKQQEAKATATPDDEVVKNEKKASTKPGKQYEVQDGDTISTVAEANGVGMEELAEYNSIPYPYNLTVGQVIVIPQ